MRVVEPIEIDLDKKRHLLLKLGNLKRAERELNKSRGTDKAIFTMMREEMAKFDRGEACSYDFCEAILWAALRHEDKELTIEQVGDLPWDLREIHALVVRLLIETYIKVDHDENEVVEILQDEEKKSLTRLNGTESSGASPASS